MASIWKFVVTPTDQPVQIYAPASMQPLFLGVDGNDHLCMWAQVHKDNPIATHNLWVVGTGWEYDALLWQHVSSCVVGGFVWHLLKERR